MKYLVLFCLLGGCASSVPVSDFHQESAKRSWRLRQCAKDAAEGRGCSFQYVPERTIK